MDGDVCQSVKYRDTHGPQSFIPYDVFNFPSTVAPSTGQNLHLSDTTVDRIRPKVEFELSGAVQSF